MLYLGILGTLGANGGLLAMMRRQREASPHSQPIRLRDPLISSSRVQRRTQ
jgi:hypothetical protein